MDAIIPIGKYKGQSLSEVAATDSQYLEWLAQQAWFAQKYQSIFALIKAGVQSGETETPEHNAIQVRFLKDDFREAVAAATWFPSTNLERFAGDAVELEKKNRKAKALQAFADATGLDFEETYSGWRMEILKRTRKRLRHIRKNRRTATNKTPQADSFTSKMFREIDESSRKEGDEQRRKILTAYVAYRQDLAELRKWKPSLTISIQTSKPKFELPCDVYYAAYRLAQFEDGTKITSPKLILFVEIKTSLGDDYPAVLRQILAQQERSKSKVTSDFQLSSFRWVLLAAEFSAVGANIEQVKEIMGQHGIELVLLPQVAAQSH